MCRDGGDFRESCSEKGRAGGDTGEPGLEVRLVVTACKEASKEEGFNGLVVKVRGAEYAIAFELRDNNRREL